MTEQIPCRHCKHKGCVVCKDNMYYAQCTHCNHWSPFQFLGISKEKAIYVWNDGNSTEIKRKLKERDKIK